MLQANEVQLLPIAVIYLMFGLQEHVCAVFAWCQVFFSSEHNSCDAKALYVINKSSLYNFISKQYFTVFRSS